MERVRVRLANGSALLVHHAPFDVDFLKRAFRATGARWPKPPIVDTRVLVSRVEERIQQLQPYAAPLPRSLTELCEMFGLPPFEAHHALGDALATAQLVLALRARLGAKTLRQLRARSGAARPVILRERRAELWRLENRARDRRISKWQDVAHLPVSPALANAILAFGDPSSAPRVAVRTRSARASSG